MCCIALRAPVSNNTAQAEDATNTAREEKKSTQTELDDLLMVFADLEEKVAGYKVRLDSDMAYASHLRFHC